VERVPANGRGRPSAFHWLIAAALLLTSACNGPSTAGSGTTLRPALDRIQQSRVLRVGYVRFAPCAELNPKTGKLEGIFIDAVNEIAANLRMQVEFKETTLANFSAALAADEFDFSVGPTFITPARAAAVTFTRPLVALGNSGLVRKGRAQEFLYPDALGRKGLAIAVLQGQAMEEFVRTRFPTAKLTVIAGSDLTAPLLAVEAGQADVGLTNAVTVQQYANSHPDTEVVFSEENALSRLALAWVVRRGDEQTRAFLDSSIEWLMQSGKLTEIEARYPIRLSGVR